MKLGQKERKKLINYFKKVPKIHISIKIVFAVLLAISIVTAVLCFLNLFFFENEYIWIPFILFCLLIFVLIIYFLRLIYLTAYKATQKEIDIQYLKLVSKADLIELGKEKFGFSDNQAFITAPVIFHNYADKAQKSLSTPFYSKRGKDGLFRSSHIVSLAYFFGKEILFQFGFICDLFGDIKYTVCDEIYYRDISKNIQVTSVTISAPTAKGSSDIVREKIIMQTNSHGEISIPYWNTDSQKDSFNKMRQYLRYLHSEERTKERIASKEIDKENLQQSIEESVLGRQ